MVFWLIFFCGTWRKKIFDLTIYISVAGLKLALNLPYNVRNISLKRRQPLPLLDLRAILYGVWSDVKGEMVKADI